MKSQTIFLNKITEEEAEKASNSYLMSLIAVSDGVVK